VDLLFIDGEFTKGLFPFDGCKILPGLLTGLSCVFPFAIIVFFRFMINDDNF